VRAKAGGRQSAHDASGRAPKSAGASLRRYNEQALQKVSPCHTVSVAQVANIFRLQLKP
jgi:hypothetical protein